MLTGWSEGSARGGSVDLTRNIAGMADLLSEAPHHPSLILTLIFENG